MKLKEKNGRQRRKIRIRCRYYNRTGNVGAYSGIFWITSRNAQALGSIASAEQLRRGSEQQFTCEVRDAKIKDGTKVVWTVNGKKLKKAFIKRTNRLLSTIRQKS